MPRDVSNVMRELDVYAAELAPTAAGELPRKRDAVPLLNVLLTIGQCSRDTSCM